MPRQRLRPRVRFRITAMGMLLLAAGLAATVLPTALAQNRVVLGVDEPDEGYWGVYLPTDRALARAMAQAEARLEAGEYHQALTLLDQVLSRDEDVFLDPDDDAGEARGLKATARDLIANLPADGRSAYELLHAAAARRQLDAALAANDRRGMAAVVRRYFHTPAGREAALVLAQMELDRGQPHASAALLEQLRNSPAATEDYEPQLSILAARSWVAAGNMARAEALLATLPERYAGETIELGGRSIKIPPSTSALAAELMPSLEQASLIQQVESDWATHRGNAARQANRPGGAPHMRLRWQARVVNDPRVESVLAKRRAQFAQRDVAVLPAARPIAVGNVVLMRTPTNVVAIDWQTGKRLWETREQFDERFDQLTAEFVASADQDELASLSHPFEQRVWDDVLAMSISSDGRRVFVVNSPAIASGEEVAGWGMVRAFGGAAGLPTASNHLAAYDLATEGKLVWELSGSRAAGDLAGAFFLGPPLAVGDMLLVMAEIRSAVYLLELEPSTGEVRWRQQLVNLEQGITMDPLRRTSGATPSYSSGVLVCPTGAGVVVALDAVKREFAWVYRYAHDDALPQNANQIWRRRVRQQQVRENDRWLDGDAVIADGRVFVTPPESDELHCLDLFTGRLLWKRMRDDGLMIGSVDQDNLLVVASQSIQVLRVQDGMPATPDEVDLPPGTMPAGHGYTSQGRFYLPLDSGQIVAIDVSDGKIVSRIQASAGSDPGNLICHRGSVISQSALVLDKFEQIELLRERVESTLADDPADASALRDLAEMHRVDGEVPAAVRLLKRANKLLPNDPVTREMLAEGLLELLAADYASHQDDLPLLRQLVQGRPREMELLRIEAEGLQSLGQRLEAMDVCLAMADRLEPDAAPVEVSEQRQVKLERWIRARVNAIWSGSSASQRRAIAARLRARRESWEPLATAAEMRHYLANFAGLPGTDDVRIALARLLVDVKEPLEAELELLQLERSPELESQAAATVLMVMLLKSTDSHDDMAPFMAALAGPLKDVTALDGRTGGDWLRQFVEEGTMIADPNGQSWPRGRIRSEVIPPASDTSNSDRRARAERQTYYRDLRVEQVYRPGLGVPQWLISGDFRRLVGRNRWGEDVYRLEFARDSLVRQFRIHPDVPQAAQLGHLLIVSLGSQVVAMDTRQSGGEVAGDEAGSVLWNAYPLGRFVGRSNRDRGGQRPGVYHGWSNRQRVTGPGGALLASLGPVTPQGVVLQQRDKLTCIDPATGDTLWSRMDIPAGCELLGDDRFLLAADFESSTVHVVDMIDGALIDSRPLPKPPWMLTAGNNVAHFTYNGARQLVLQIEDVLSDRLLFEEQFEQATRLATVEPYFVLAFQPSGRFLCIDVRTGDVLVDQPLQEVERPVSIHGLRSDRTLFLAVNTETLKQQYRPIGPDFPLVTGQLYAFDLDTGRPLWPGPATLNHRGIALNQAADSPLLVLVDRIMKRDASGGNSQLRLLCLDKQTGQSVYRNDSLPDTVGGYFRTLAERGIQPSLTVEMSSRAIRLLISDEPRPPAPPANDAVEAPRKTLGRGLWGLGQRMSHAIQDALQNPQQVEWPDVDPNDLENQEAPLEDENQDD